MPSAPPSSYCDAAAPNAARPNAASEVAVDAFLGERIRFAGISAATAAALDAWDGGAAESLESVNAADARARRAAEDHIREHQC
ncbi:hypothetical protein BH23GEM3_BH23GEM3_10130 [soil metagenome]